MRALLLAAVLASAGLAQRTTADQPPRKVIVGTVVRGFWVKYPGLQARLDELAGIVDRLAGEAKQKYGRGLDLAVLPEVAVTGGIYGDILNHSAPLEGAVRDTFARKAREHRCYIVVPLYLLEDREKRLVYNAAVVVGRQGEITGIYRKLHLAVPAGSDVLEGGVTPGREVPVFDCDFGRLGVQICFDMSFDYGWRELARKGAELVAWTTQSPQTARPAFRALEGRYWIVSGTWRDNASIFEPTGKIAAQVKPPGEMLVEEIDLSYAILPWSARLGGGAALRKLYGDRVGFRYYVEEDLGIFWSNDAKLPIGTMMRAIGVAEVDAERERIRRLYDKAGVPGGR